MKHAITISIFLSMIISVNGRILNVGHDQEFKTIRAAALVSKPGDTILVKTGNIQGGEIIENLRGTSQTWITIIAERAINIGGSTGMEFFRPLGASWEATSIHVWSNIFEGSGATVAFVGSNSCDVVNNTIINTSMWVMRILQENNNKGMEKCSNNIFMNNLILFSAKNRPAVNIGPNTLPGTFIFSSNLWCNPADPAWRGPELPVNDSYKIISHDPGFADGEFHI